MKKNGLNYTMVNVISPYGGYSFMVTSRYENLTEEEIILLCQEKMIFQEDDDFKYAETDDLIDDDDIQQFVEFTYCLDD